MDEVYCVFACYDIDGDFLLKIYSNEEEAKEHMTTMNNVFLQQDGSLNYRWCSVEKWHVFGKQKEDK